MLRALTCPNCGDSNLGDDYRCHSCGSLLDPAARNAVRCPDCNQPCGQGDRFCPRCGTSLAQACPFCGEQHPAGTTFCAKSGGDLRVWSAFQALQSGQPEAADALKAQRGLQGLDKRMGTAQRTLLHAAAEKGRTDLVAHLLKLKADPNARTGNDETPLHLAAAAGHAETCALLLQHRAEPNARTRQGRTPLHQAAARGRLLPLEGADLHARDEDDRNALHLACLHGHRAVAAWLLEQGLDVDDASNALKETPLLLAAQGGHEELLEALLDAGARLDAVDWNGRNALHLAAWCNRHHLMDNLLDRGFDPDAVDAMGSTPLHLAAERGHLPAMQLLLAHGARTDLRDRGRLTPAERADRYGRKDAVALLG